MTLRIGVENDQTPRASIRLEGRLTREELPELERVIANGLGPLRIDVTHLMSVDPDGLEALKRLRASGVEIQGASPYLRLLLGESV